jgi:vacuolar-type H+-ATPase subunit E/Vma4
MSESSLLKGRTSKANYPEARTTLDALHNQKMNELIDETKNLPQYKEQIDALKAKIATSTAVTEIWSLEQQLGRLEKKVKSIESGDAINDYYLRTGNILFEYYDIQDKIRKGASVSTQTTKAKPGSILAILGHLEREEGNTTGGPKGSLSAPQRSDLLNQYLQIEDPGLAKTPEGSDDNWTQCDECGAEMIMCMNEATMTCSKCGNKDFILIDSDKPSYKDPPRELSYYAYKKINHFNEWLAQFQAKESTEIPAGIYDQILLQLKKERISNFGSLKRTKLREILRHMGETKYYEHIPHIINRLSGQNAPFMSREDEEKLRHMFREIQPAFKKHIPKGRRNFLSYGYILYKFCELLEMDEHLACFPLLKNRDKLYIQDQAWKGICSDMQWQFIRTV